MKGVRWADGLEKLLMPIELAKPDPENPNNGDVEAVIESIQINGFNQVITVNRKTGHIVAGHTRQAALYALGSKVAPYVWVDQDREGHNRYLIGDNETGKLAVLDHAQEARILRMLHETERGLAGTGVTEAKYLDILNRLVNPPIPQEPGFGNSIAPSGIYQVVLSFQSEDDRDEFYAELPEHYRDNARTVNL